MSGPDGPCERLEAGLDGYEAVLDQIELDEAEADTYSEDPEQWSHDDE